MVSGSTRSGHALWQHELAEWQHTQAEPCGPAATERRSWLSALHVLQLAGLYICPSPHL